ncbi:hypothetical protein FH972_024058 [Carpinus fangiana]|uniref:Uncharacterized protein n=1 Tax=Carpinus fangiana TaxID=176857 RepID=A0A5N6KXA6_9ROSI|nr:hypothetical protein FH972_024058 [Carpinus fangiana]
MPSTPPDTRPDRKRKRPVHEHDIARRPSNRWSPPPAFYDNLSKLPLCRQVLREFDRRTQQYPEPGNDMPPRRDGWSDELSQTSQTNSRSRGRTSKISAYNPAFNQHLNDHGIHTGNDACEAENIDQIRNALLKRRASLSPSNFTQEHFKAFRKSNDEAMTEAATMSVVFGTIVGKSDIPNQQNVQFGNLAPLTDGSLTVAQPDFYDGCQPRDIKKSVRDKLSDYIIPSTNSLNPALPNFFVEGKGPGGNAAVSRLQVCYDAAFGARAIYKLRSYVDPDTAVDGNAYTISATYNGGPGSGTLTLYATHLATSEDPNRPVDYHMTQLRGWLMTDSAESFRQGAAAIRNAREWAQEQRKALIAAANAKASTLSAQTSLSAASQSTVDMHEPDTSADELAEDQELYRARSSRSVPSASRSRTLSTTRSRKPKRRRGDNQE